jgi:hypothetical protein
MHFLAPFVVHGALGLRTNKDIEEVAQQYQKLILFLIAYHDDWKKLTVGENFQTLTKSLPGGL